MMIAIEFIEQGHPIGKVLNMLSIPSSTYNYRCKIHPERKGKKKSTYTYTVDGMCVLNDQVVSEIKELLSQEFVDYGYRKVTHWLRQNKKYVINEKKVYRLMKDNQLLNTRIKKNRSPRQWVKQLVPDPLYDLSYMEIDIKYLYIVGARKNALLLSAIDVKSRWVLGQYLAWQVNKYDVIDLFDGIFSSYDLPSKIYVRNDNGSQFEASLVRAYFQDLGVEQEFIRPATPEQNGHIEAYHSIIEKIICQGYEFDNLEEAQQTMDRFLKFYNYERLHSGISYLSPFSYLRSKGVIIEKYDVLRDTLSCKHVNLNPK